jgi:hypothetical protein
MSKDREELLAEDPVGTHNERHEIYCPALLLFVLIFLSYPILFHCEIANYPEKTGK